MNYSIIKTEQEYNKALERLDLIFDTDPNSKEGIEAELLALLVENYEEQHHTIEAPGSNSCNKN